MFNSIFITVYTELQFSQSYFNFKDSAYSTGDLGLIPYSFCFLTYINLLTSVSRQVVSFNLILLKLSVRAYVSKPIFPHIYSQYTVLIFSLLFVVQQLSQVQLFATPWTASRQVSLSFTISQSLLKFKSIESVMPSNHLVSVALFSSFPQSFPPSGSFPMCWLFTSGGQTVGASTSA